MNRLVLATLVASISLSLSLSASAQSSAPAAAGSKPKAESNAPKDPLKGLKKSRDDMKGVSWYQHPSSPKYRNANGLYLYFGKYDDGRITPLRLATQYYADDWLFVSRAWAKADGVNVDIPSESKRFMGWERDNSGGSIWEWSDTALTTASEIAAVRTLANAKTVTVRFEGRQYYNDRKLAPQSMKAMREVIEAYEAVTGKPWN